MGHTFVAVCAVLGGLIILIAACSSPPAAAPEPPRTWGGDLTPVVSVQELMRDMIDPLADNIFTAIGTEVTSTEVRDWGPRTDEDWSRVRLGAVSMAEASYLLKIPRPIEPAGWEDIARDPDSDELAPPDVLALINKDPVLWQAKIEVLRNVGREVLEIVEKKDANALWGAAEDLENACEGCHLEFWYPDQKALMRRLWEKESAARRPTERP